INDNVAVLPAVSCAVEEPSCLGFVEEVVVTFCAGQGKVMVVRGGTYIPSGAGIDLPPVVGDGDVSSSGFLEIGEDFV
ncbi:MAG: hypothetical protein XD63_0647, partial [Thermoanaerobacterales bacterium 50_218]